MTTVAFFDSSALVRRYLLGEPHSERIREVLASDAQAVLVSHLAIVEVTGALATAVRAGRLTIAQGAELRAIFVYDATVQYLVQAPTDEVWRRAVEIVGEHPVRALDAIHIAAAMTISRGVRTPDVFRFYTADRRQAAAATAAGLDVELIGGEPEAGA